MNLQRYSRLRATVFWTKFPFESLMPLWCMWRQGTGFPRSPFDSLLLFFFFIHDPSKPKRNESLSLPFFSLLQSHLRPFDDAIQKREGRKEGRRVPYSPLCLLATPIVAVTSEIWHNALFNYATKPYNIGNMTLSTPSNKGLGHPNK